MSKSNLKKGDYYKHETLRQFLVIGILWVIAQLIPKTSPEAAEVYNTVVIIFALATVIALVLDYVFFWNH
jgi:hypothetical protein